MNNERDRDPELTDWRAEWASLGGKDGFVVDVLERADQETGRMRRAAMREVLGACISSAICTWLSVRSRGAPEVVALMCLIVFFNGVWLTRFFSLREGLFRGTARGLDEFVDLTRKRLAAELRFVDFARRWTSIIGVVLVPWAIWMFLAHRDGYTQQPWRAVVGFGGAAGIFAAVVVLTRRKAGKLAAESARFERQLAEATLE
jgi:hypothetical protein